MGNFGRNNDRGGNRGGFRGGDRGGRPSFGGGRGGDRGPVTMHKAVCDKCHKDCEVPFRPSNDKPIYCNDCFGGKKDNNRGNDSRKNFGDRGPKREFRDRPAQQNENSNVSLDIKKQLDDMNVKLDNLVNALTNLSLPKTTTKVKEVSKVAKSPAKKTVSKPKAKKVVVKKKK